MRRYFIRFNPNSDTIETLIRVNARRPNELNWQELTVDYECEHFKHLESLAPQAEIAFRNMTGYGAGYKFRIRLIGEQGQGYYVVDLTSTDTLVKTKIPVEGTYTITLTILEGNDLTCDVSIPAAAMSLKAVVQGNSYVSFNNNLAGVYNLNKHCV